MRITVPMYEKGRSFLMAANLIKAYDGHKFVYLHLLCQGFENIGKSILLLHNYDKYGPLLKNHYQHHLDRLLKEINTLEEGQFISKDAEGELFALNEFYKKQKLRYGDEIDFMSIPDLQADRLHRELAGHLNMLNLKFETIDDA